MPRTNQSGAPQGFSFGHFLYELQEKIFIAMAMIRHGLIVLALFAIDRFTKYYIIANPAWLSDRGGFIDLYLNKNLAFSWPLVTYLFYPVLVILIIVVVSFWWRDLWAQKLTVWPWALIMIGAFSNFFDRIIYGGVVDWVNLGFFPVFNISDIYISLGTLWLLVMSFSRRPNLTK